MTHDEVFLVDLDVLGDLAERSKGDQPDITVLVAQSCAEDLEHAGHHVVDKVVPDRIQNGVQHKDGGFTMSGSGRLARLGEEGDEVGPLVGRGAGR